MKFSIAPMYLYQNSYIHYCKKKLVTIYDEKKEVIVYVLDRRFLKTNNLDDIHNALPYCRLKHLDKDFIEVISYYPINQQQLFYRLSELDLIVNIEEFIKIVEGG